MEQSTVETWRRPYGAWAWEPRERDNIAAVAIIFTTSFPCGYRQQAVCAGPSGPWEQATLIPGESRLRRQTYTPVMKQSTAEIWQRTYGSWPWDSRERDNMAAVVIIFTTSFVNGKNLAAPVWSVSVSHVSVTTLLQWLLYFQLASPADISSKPSVPVRPARESRKRLYIRGESRLRRQTYTPVMKQSTVETWRRPYGAWVWVTWAWQHSCSGYYIYVQLALSMAKNLAAPVWSVSVSHVSVTI